MRSDRSNSLKVGKNSPARFHIPWTMESSASVLNPTNWRLLPEKSWMRVGCVIMISFVRRQNTWAYHHEFEETSQRNYITYVLLQSNPKWENRLPNSSLRYYHTWERKEIKSNPKTLMQVNKLTMIVQLLKSIHCIDELYSDCPQGCHYIFDRRWQSYPLL